MRYDALGLSDVLLEARRSPQRHEGVFITVDEIQKIPEADMENLCAAVQMSMRKGMPVALMLAGLPGSKELVSAYRGCTFMKRVADVHLDSLLVSETYDAFRRLMGKEQRQLSTVRDRLIKKRAIVASGRGYVRYNLPKMHQYFTDPLAFPFFEDEDTWKHEWLPPVSFGPLPHLSPAFKTCSFTSWRGDERGGSVRDVVATDDPWLQFRALVNVRPPWPASEALLVAQDELLQGMIAEAGVHGIDEAAPSPADPRLLLWRGDITTLSADAVVNAANSQMLGCWALLHYCIDNAIHTFAGVQLRIECARLMGAQSHDEPTGQAKATPAYNLPAGRVIHTVGPIADGHPTDEHRAQLASCYESCLATAASEGLRTVAFCCISTGVFGFPSVRPPK